MVMNYATREEMRRLDRLAVNNGLQIRQMMELASWHILSLFNELEIENKEKVCVVVGKGNKGGDGICAARHLINHGYEVNLMLVSKKLVKDAKHQMSLFEKMQVNKLFYVNNKKHAENILSKSDLIIDEMIGYNLEGAPRKNYADIINLVNHSGKKVIAYDIPTGIDATTGECFEPHIKADFTLTLALPKKAFKKRKASSASGRIFLADIGIPSFIYEKISKGIRPRFNDSDISLIKIS